ncbi:unnamed protein product [Nippostrongylus brasiliensis]|uniref:MHYT domain-containing protein n=1 Tax=Nippostrongylus brasiliensis TaxID=27835 RepID=A0A0N4YL53_NIPBR|nr:hypothetical protein Q1695_006173 [Nippostrongylus brasiliensis]VDL81531.1 unnamed protein product [Nippostrongylus brasiliensis]
MYYNFPIFAVLFLGGGIFQLQFDMYYSRKTVNSLLQSVKCCCLIIFGMCASTVHSTFLAYLEERPCHTYVPREAALMEYFCLASVAMFWLCQLSGLQHIVVVLPSLPADQSAAFSTEYAHP